MDNLNRRKFLNISAGAVAATPFVPKIIYGGRKSDTNEEGFPIEKIIKESKLKAGELYPFVYSDLEVGNHYLLKLERKIFDGVGPGKNIIGFAPLNYDDEIVALKNEILVVGSQEFDLNKMGKCISKHMLCDLQMLDLEYKDRSIWVKGYF